MVSQKDQRHKNISNNVPYTLLDTLGFVYHNDRVIQIVGSKKTMYQRENSIQFKNMNQYPKGSQAIVLINL